MSNIQVLPEVEEELTKADGRAHYVRMDVLVRGGIVVALCGKKYIPTIVGPEVVDMELCPSCAELMQFLASMDTAG